MPKNKKKSKKNSGTRKVLEGYKRHGKKFIPPAFQLSVPLQETNYIQVTLPEIIWMGLINDDLGYQDGANSFINLATEAKKIHQSDKHKNFSLCSSYSQLTSKERSELINAIGGKAHTQLQTCLEPLIVLYKGFPLSFLGRKEVPSDNRMLIDKLKRCVARHFNKYEVPALVILSAITYIGIATGKMHFLEGVKVPNLNSILTNPDSDEANRAAGFVRNNAMSEVMGPNGQPDLSWASSFWNQGLKIDACEFEEADK